MATPNNIGYVVELIEERIPPSSATRVRLRLRLRNTLGHEKTIVVDAPSEVGDFFAVHPETEEEPFNLSDIFVPNPILR